jgi:hypothetical protein
VLWFLLVRRRIVGANPARLMNVEVATSGS